MADTYKVVWKGNPPSGAHTQNFGASEGAARKFAEERAKQGGEYFVIKSSDTGATPENGSWLYENNMDPVWTDVVTPADPLEWPYNYPAAS